jgi:hypothetical protein
MATASSSVRILASCFRLPPETNSPDDQGPGVGRGVEHLVQLVHGGRRDGVAGLRTVDGDDRQAIIELKIDVHASPNERSAFSYLASSIFVTWRRSPYRRRSAQSS